MKHRIVLLFAIILFSIVGCGDSDTALRGQFIDAPVQGISYSTATQIGTTTINGYFNYKSGETVTFKIGSLILGSAIGDLSISPVDFVTNGTTSNTTVLNVCRLLQSLDSDTNENTITIPAGVLTNATAANAEIYISQLDFSNSETFDTLAANLIAELTLGVNEYQSTPFLVGTTTARQHLEYSLALLASPSPSLFSVIPFKNSSPATSIFDAFQIDFRFSDLEGDLNGGTFCMDWGGHLQYSQLDTYLPSTQIGSGQISFPYFLAPPLVGNIIVQCWLIDKAGNESEKESFLFTQTTPYWPWQLGSSSDDWGGGLAIDSEDNLFVSGMFRSGDSLSRRSPFIAKYFSDAFCDVFLPFDNPVVGNITVDEENNIYFTTIINADSPYSVLVSKYDNNYDLIWDEILASSESDHAGGMAIDSNDNVYVTGGTRGDLDGNVNAGTDGGPGMWMDDIFVAKYDFSGNKQWTRQLGNGLSQSGTAIAIDSVNNVYVVGDTEGSLDGQSRRGYYHFLLKYDSSGDKIWLNQFGRVPVPGSAADIAIDSLDNIYIAGKNSSDLNPNASVGFVRKFNTSGELQWVQMMGGPSWRTACYAISLDQNGNIVVTGSAYGTADSDTPTDSTDAFVAKYDPSGTQVWFTLFSTPSYDKGYAIAVDSNNYIYVTGTTEGSLPNFTNAGYEDIFIAKFDPNGILQK